MLSGTSDRNVSAEWDKQMRILNGTKEYEHWARLGDTSVEQGSVNVSV